MFAVAVLDAVAVTWTLRMVTSRFPWCLLKLALWKDAELQEMKVGLGEQAAPRGAWGRTGVGGGGRASSPHSRNPCRKTMRGDGEFG